ncbi:uncharacterized protein LOC115878186 [Sitophilus oryzae]|uniref:Uncharacterized protein LOC115878186 n=1 Tax=Sitophilus oryzae TaxID=7048 RepID=A0A6J2XGQ3_SITOR|nr:uncharacterized protein LOC115878186 [Sitophilus oryzae]
MPGNFNNQKTQFVVGDFNCHSTTWGYGETDSNGQLLEQWAEATSPSLLHDPKLPCSFNSKIWKRGYNPDNCFVSRNIHDTCCKNVYNAIPKTQHRPIGIQVYSTIKTTKISFRRRFNFMKARWPEYSQVLDEEITNLAPTPSNYHIFVESLRKISRRYIPRGCRQHYIPGLSNASRDTLEQYEQLFAKDPFSDQTITCETALMTALSEAREKKWIETLDRMGMSHSSKIAWNLIKKLDGDPKLSKAPSNVTPNQVANQLLLNGKFNSKRQKTKIKRLIPTENTNFQKSFTMKKLNNGINTMKNGKAAVIDDVCVEQIKNFGPGTKKWILKLFNLYERLILYRIEKTVDSKLIPQQAGFRPGKSCTSQILALTEHIEEGFENKHITGLALVDLSSAYDTVNHKILLHKANETLKEYHLVKILESLLQNRQFFVTLKGKKSRWRNQNNGLAQGSVLAPILFNIYTNDQPIPDNTITFAYADDLAITVEGKGFEDIEEKLESALKTMSTYYKKNSLKPNPTKTKVSAFRLNSRQATRRLNVTWDGTQLEHTDKPTYLGVVLDRTLTYKYHCEKTRKKVEARNSLIRKLTNSKWGAKPTVVRTSAQALCFSTAEYACPVWCRSVHAKKLNISLYETCRIVTGCMKPTPLENLYKAAGFTSPDLRRKAHEHTEKLKQTFDARHSIFGQECGTGRLKSRRRFLSHPLDEPPSLYPLERTHQMVFLATGKPGECSTESELGWPQ